MMYSFKIVLDKRYQKKNSTYPIKLRVYLNSNYKEYSLGIAIPESDWDEKSQMVFSSNSNYKIYNAKIISIKAKVQKCILFIDDDNMVSPEEIIQQVKNNGKQKKVLLQADIIKYTNEHISKLQRAGQIGNSIVYSCTINKVKGFVKTEKLTFEQVNYSFLERFNTALLNEGLKVNSISNYLRTIRALFNKAIKEKLISPDIYPFNSFKIKSEKTINRTLTISEMQQIVRLDLQEGSTIWHHRNLFLLSFYLIGINFSDLLTLTKNNFVDGRIIFHRRKTNKVYSIQIHPRAEEIFNYYRTLSVGFCRGKGKSFLLPFVSYFDDPMKLKKDLTQAIKNTNDYLVKIASICRIEKDITTYYARYSWANIARGLGYSKDMIAEALGHQYGNQVTGIYLDKYEHEIIDSINEKIITCVFRKEG